MKDKDSVLAAHLIARNNGDILKTFVEYIKVNRQLELYNEVQ